MSDGTKQGTVIPLTTDYKNRLKSEFENKTGITIDYIIIHPYTGETIDIESSITINSGDTPTKTLFKWGLNHQENPLVCGYLDQGKGEFRNCYIYRDTYKENGVAVFDETGKRLSPGVDGYSWFEQTLLDDLERTFGEQFEYCFLTDCPVGTGETLANWDEYTNVHQ